jgi:hypothetical protein
MANQEHLDILQQGVKTWNRWREQYPEILPDLSGAHLSRVSLNDVRLSRANLSRANLSDAHLRRAHLRGARLSNAHLRGARLSGTDLSGADLQGADLRETDLSGAHLRETDLSRANLSRTDLSSAHLIRVDLSSADFSGARLRQTSFEDVDLREIKGLKTVLHEGPSTIGIDTIYRSEGHIPEEFLQKAGVPGSFITYMRSLVINPIDYYTCFISYSNLDEAFARRLYADLQSQGVRCWFAPEDMKIGDKMRVRIDESIRLYDKLLLVLSEHSVKSPWVEKEVETAFEKERQHIKEVLFPLRVDETVMHTSQAWAADIRRTRHIGDFTRWKQQDDYQQAFERLLRDLKAEA